MLPKITFEGTVVADPELRFTPQGVGVANFRIVANDRKKNAAGEWEDADATFISVTAWRQLAENVVESLHKGDRVIVVGKLRQQNWEDKEGNKRSSYEILADNVGVSIVFATATINRVERSKKPVDDAEFKAPPQSDEPPF